MLPETPNITDGDKVGRDQRKGSWNVAEKVMVKPQSIESLYIYCLMYIPSMSF